MLMPDHPAVFLSLNLLAGCFLTVGWWYFRSGLYGDSRAYEEGVGMTRVPDLWSGLILFAVGTILVACSFAEWF
jgi:hypothetical protein